MGTLIPILMVALVAFWAVQFISLMQMADDQFVGPHDKILWAVAFIFVFFAAPFAFYFWRARVRAAQSAAQQQPPGNNPQSGY